MNASNLRSTVLAVAVGFGLATMAWGQGTATTEPGHGTTKTMEAAKTKEPASAMKFEGTVASVDAKAMSFKLSHTMKDATGKQTSHDMEVQWNASTKLMWRDEASKEPRMATSGDLVEGMHVKVMASKTADGKLMAERVWLKKAAPAATESTTSEHKP